MSFYQWPPTNVCCLCFSGGDSDKRGGHFGSRKKADINFAGTIQRCEGALSSSLVQEMMDEATQLVMILIAILT